MGFRDGLSVVTVVIAVCVLCQHSEARSVFSNNSTGEVESLQPAPMEELIMKAAKSREDLSLFWDGKHHMLKAEYDIVYSLEEWADLHSKNRPKRGAGFSTDHSNRWTNNVLNYEIMKSQTTKVELDEIKQALKVWAQYTCLKFNETSEVKNRIRMQDGGGCSSRVGMMGGIQVMSLAKDCRVKRVVLHELAHAIGLHHEQTRPDRDDYVTINYGNIEPRKRYNFDLYTWKVVMNLSVPYDYRSIMHYSSRMFSKNGDYTIVTNDRQYQTKIGRYNNLSFRDIKTVNLMYNCYLDTPLCKLQDKDCPGEGFVGKDCTCWCPGDPVKYCFDKDRKSKGDLNRVCQDKEIECPMWAKSGYCPMAVMIKKCPKSCNKCGAQ